jgi:hypothetical protein
VCCLSAGQVWLLHSLAVAHLLCPVDWEDAAHVHGCLNLHVIWIIQLHVITTIWQSILAAPLHLRLLLHPVIADMMPEGLDLVLVWLLQRLCSIKINIITVQLICCVVQCPTST